MRKKKRIGRPKGSKNKPKTAKRQVKGFLKGKGIERAYVKELDTGILRIVLTTKIPKTKVMDFLREMSKALGITNFSFTVKES